LHAGHDRADAEGHQAERTTFDLFGEGLYAVHRQVGIQIVDDFGDVGTD